MEKTPCFDCPKQDTCDHRVDTEGDMIRIANIVDSFNKFMGIVNSTSSSRVVFIISEIIQARLENVSTFASDHVSPEMIAEIKQYARELANTELTDVVKEIRAQEETAGGNTL